MALLGGPCRVRPGRRLVAGAAPAAVAVLAVLAVLAAPAALAGPAAAAPAGLLVCTVQDPRLAGLSGLAARGGQLYAVSDQPPAAVYELGPDCGVTAVRPVPGRFVDVEDLALRPDGTLWLGDTGGNRVRRDVVALHALSADGKRTTAHPLRYPDGPHDAEAFVVAADGTVLVVTKSSSGVAGVYAAPAPVLPDETTPLRRVADVDLRDVPGRTPGDGSTLVTGAALSPDGTRLVLRTYLDAYEWDAPDTDLVAALRDGEPRVVPLPASPQGEAVAYAADGASLLVGTEGSPAPLHQVPLARPRQGRAPAAPASPVGGLVPGALGVAAALSLGLAARRARSRATGAPVGSTGGTGGGDR
ncbi:hypothetical protein [Vallicoccus soli]|uniref:WD40 repeat domain-containing protein n=1 Tax=Vallicoccus soli TaxID=2339232 RepID=A0A3A3ZML9_9ACTN|nr:hypothetical protein [Vallicoccus soli]RJK97911.1 hypothetical protein D5H78_02790 [Vallicoccus soli]